MAIKFICSCGKHLRARDEMAARRSLCPRCGAPVGIPSLRPTHPGTSAAPMSPGERVRNRAQVTISPVSFAEEPPAPATVPSPTNPPCRLADEAPAAGLAGEARGVMDTSVVRLVRPRDHRRQHLEAHWYECFLYPLKAFPLILGLAAVLTVVSGTAVFALHEILELRARWPENAILLPPLLLVALTILGYTLALLEGALISTVSRKNWQVRWPGCNVGLALASGGRWLIVLLAGPVVPAAAVVTYWINCGDPTLVDWLIMAELLFLAVGYGLLAFVTVSGSRRFVANPVRVAQLVHRLGKRAAAAASLASVLVVAHGGLAVVAAVSLHHDAVAGWVLLAFSWISGLFLGTFLFRLLGVWCCQLRANPW